MVHLISGISTPPATRHRQMVKLKNITFFQAPTAIQTSLHHQTLEAFAQTASGTISDGITTFQGVRQTRPDPTTETQRESLLSRWPRTLSNRRHSIEGFPRKSSAHTGSEFELRTIGVLSECVPLYPATSKKLLRTVPGAKGPI
jgi:hypothetical protein